MLLIFIITTYKEKPRKSDACRLLIFCENQIGELTPPVCAAIGWLFGQSKSGCYNHHDCIRVMGLGNFYDDQLDDSRWYAPEATL